MDRKRRITLGAATLAVALGAGHLVQSGFQKIEERRAADEPQPTAIVPLAASTEPEMVPAIANAALTALPVPKAAVTREAPVPAPLSGDIVPEAAAAAPPAPVPTVIPVAIIPVAVPSDPALTVTPAVEAPAVEAPVVEASATPAELPAPAADACPVTLGVTAMPKAMLDLALSAPCAAGSRVVLRHGGLAVTGRVSEAGTLFTRVPAMEAEGAVSVLFPDGASVRAAAPVDLVGVHRFAVQWLAADAFQVQAYENGAGFGMPGHVHATAPEGPGGWMTELGDATVDLPMRAEVYTFPTTADRVDLVVEAAVTEATCSRELLGEVVESEQGSLTTTEITLAMPACDGQGGFLVLNNLAGGTTLASAN